MICGSAVLEKFKTLRRAIDCPLKFGPLGKRVLTDKQAAVCARFCKYNFHCQDVMAGGEVINKRKIIKSVQYFSHFASGFKKSIFRIIFSQKLFFHSSGLVS